MELAVGTRKSAAAAVVEVARSVVERSKAAEVEREAVALVWVSEPGMTVDTVAAIGEEEVAVVVVEPAAGSEGAAAEDSWTAVVAADIGSCSLVGERRLDVRAVTGLVAYSKNLMDLAEGPSPDSAWVAVSAVELEDIADKMVGIAHGSVNNTKRPHSGMGPGNILPNS